MVETPYDLPQGWEWVRLRTLITYQNGKAFKSSSYVKQHGFQVIRLGNVKNNKMVLGASPIFISEQDAKESLDYKIFEDDILVTMTGTKGKTDFFYTTKINSFDLEDNELFLNQRVGIIRPISSGVSPDFLNHALKEGEIKKYVFNSATGTANQSNISTVTINNILIPVPPIEEQLKINDLLSDSNQKLDSIDKEQSDIQFLANQLKQKVLDVAMQGKLVPQDPNDEPASVLLEKIRAEKQRLFEEGKIKKKDLVETEIVKGDDNAYYEKLPDSWNCVTLSSIVDYRMGKTPDTKNEAYWIGPGFPWVSIADMGKNRYVTSTSRTVTEKALSEVFNHIVSPKGTLIMSFKLSIGKVGLLNQDSVHNEAIISIFPYLNDDYSLRDYLFCILPVVSNSGETVSAIKGKTLNSKKIDALPIPLPPVREQREISQTINKLYRILEVFS
ncbi:restriction endonuclease subunit S [Enterococcus faecalis]|nr:restriction endonuclease subunit S [Enterococcus faecalis]EGO2815752.1 restriction endonuclease subunit S [Enterococcus faecalis]EGO2831942.1 restriction endonuclease subunit S [Enterococcus faecalis]EGO6049143.1 restriction endonuclease subunit S [Enterococcus faecalis]ELY8229681.1 restriction endonuclease subunit S [Enterococcus faecalis]EME5818437.1 restriction endonuclease subunit S [Enterococcus faecalis]